MFPPLPARASAQGFSVGKWQHQGNGRICKMLRNACWLCKIEEDTFLPLYLIPRDVAVFVLLKAEFSESYKRGQREE